MKYCEKCGKQLNDEAVFCEGCGVRLSQPIKEKVKKNVYDNLADNAVSATEDLVEQNTAKNKLLLIIMIALSVILVVVVLIMPKRTIFEYDGITYEYSGGTDFNYYYETGVQHVLTIIAINPKSDNMSIDNIPLSIDDVPIRYINCDESNGMTSTVESITFPEHSSVYIESMTNCKNLTSIQLPENAEITSMENGAFSNCSSLKEVLFYGRAEFNGRSFVNCTSLDNIIVSNGDDVDFPYGCFSDLYSLKNVYINAGSIEIGGAAFKNCTSLESVTLQGCSFIDYESECFYGCTSLKTMTFEGFPSIKENAFGSCSSLEKINFMNTCNIYENAFKGCTSLKTVSFPKDMDEEYAAAMLLNIIIGSGISANIDVVNE